MAVETSKDWLHVGYGLGRAQRLYTTGRYFTSQSLWLDAAPWILVGTVTWYLPDSLQMLALRSAGKGITVGHLLRRGQPAAMPTSVFQHAKIAIPLQLANSDKDPWQVRVMPEWGKDGTEPPASAASCQRSQQSGVQDCTGLYRSRHSHCG